MKRLIVLAGALTLALVSFTSANTSSGPCCPAGAKGQAIDQAAQHADHGAKGCCTDKASCARPEGAGAGQCCQKAEDGTMACCKDANADGACDCCGGNCKLADGCCEKNADGCCASKDQGKSKGCCTKKSPEQK